MAEVVEEQAPKTPEKTTEEEVIPTRQPERFSLPNISSKSKTWELPTELAEFLQERCNSYLSEKELHEFLTTATPSNVKGATKLDPFMKALLEKRGLNRTVSVDDEQQKIHQKLFQVMGPLSAAWWSCKKLLMAMKIMRMNNHQRLYCNIYRIQSYCWDKLSTKSHMRGDCLS